MESAFKSGTVSNASSEDLQKWSCLLSTNSADINLRPDEDGVRIVRSLAINHAQMANLIRGIEASNKKTQILVIALAVVAIVVGIVQIFI